MYIYRCIGEVHVCIYTCTCLHLYMYASVHIHVCICTCTCMHLYMYMYASVHVHVCICTCTCMHLYMYMYASVHVHVLVFTSCIFLSATFSSTSCYAAIHEVNVYTVENDKLIARNTQVCITHTCMYHMYIQCSNVHV